MLSLTKTTRLLYLSLLSAQGILLGMIDRLSPISAFPGMTLGLANIVTLIAFVTLPKKDSFFLLLLRIALTTFLFGTPSTFLYSLSGGLLSYVAMLLVRQLGDQRVSLLSVSATGGLFHLIGQLLVAAWIAQTWRVFYLLPFLGTMGILAGLLTGYCAHVLTKHLLKVSYFTQQKKKL